MRKRELIFHTGSETGEELFVELTDRGSVEIAICSDEEPETRVVKIDDERLMWLCDALSELLAKKARPYPSHGGDQDGAA